MALTKPILYSVSGFDATKSYVFTFSSVGGDQVVSNTLHITRQDTGASVYSQTQTTLDYIHMVPANTLTNGVAYNAYIVTHNEAGDSSADSNAIQFSCYAEPTVTFTNIPSGNIINNSSFKFEATYSQAQGESVNSYIFNLYDVQGVQVSTSGVQYLTSVSAPPTTLEYTFSGFSDNATYLVECIANTVSGLQATTGRISITVSYQAPIIEGGISVAPNCQDGYMRGYIDWRQVPTGIDILRVKRRRADTFDWVTIKEFRDGDRSMTFQERSQPNITKFYAIDNDGVAIVGTSGVTGRKIAKTSNLGNTWEVKESLVDGEPDQIIGNYVANKYNTGYYINGTGTPLPDGRQANNIYGKNTDNVVMGADGLVNIRYKGNDNFIYMDGNWGKVLSLSSDDNDAPKSVVLSRQTTNGISFTMADLAVYYGVVIPYLTQRSFIYDGNTITPTIVYDEEQVTLSGTLSASAADTYHITCTLKDKVNYRWSDGTTDDKVLTWYIIKSTIGIPYLDTSSFTYTGSIIKPEILNLNDDMVAVTGTQSAINVGTYTITYSLKNANDFTWSDGTITDKTSVWSINAVVVAIPTIGISSFGYTGGVVGPTISNLDESAVTVGGTATAIEVGNYTITYTLKSTTNYVWSDNTTAPKQSDWMITAVKVAIPFIDSDSSLYTYTGATFTPEITNLNQDLVTVTGTTSAANVGTYIVTFTLKDTDNYTWTDGGITDKTAQWMIQTATVAIPYISSGTIYTYDGSTFTPTISNLSSTYVTVGGTTSASAIGNYTITYSLKSPANSKWSDGTTTNKSSAWTIKAPFSATIRVTAPSGSTVYATKGGVTYNASASGTTYTITVPETGQYYVRAYKGSDSNSTYVNVTAQTTYSVTLNYNITVTITGSGIVSQVTAAKVTINNVDYTSARTLTVASGSSIVLYAYSPSNPGQCKIIVNGTTVKTGSTEGVAITYTIRPTTNTSIKLETKSLYMSGTVTATY